MIKVKLNLAPGAEVAVLAKWRVSEGDTVSVGDVVADIEFEKATTEFEIPFNGVLDSFLVQEGDEVRAGTPILQLRQS